MHCSTRLPAPARVVHVAGYSPSPLVIKGFYYKDRQWLDTYPGNASLVHFILDVADYLDLSKIYASYEGDDRGQPPYEPGIMTGLLFYAYCMGVPRVASSPRILSVTRMSQGYN